MARPREFDEGDVLKKAMDVFWRHGYEGASLSLLTEAMGINKPSLYATFGNKEQLFRKALDCYVETKTQYFNEAMAAPTSRAVVERMLTGFIAMLVEPDHPAGCLSVTGAMSGRDENEPVRRELADVRAGFEKRLRERFEEERTDGRLQPDADPDALASFVATVIHGMSIQAADGATAEQLKKVAATALRAWPEGPAAKTAAE